jgi:hypothetical protein
MTNHEEKMSAVLLRLAESCLRNLNFPPSGSAMAVVLVLAYTAWNRSVGVSDMPCQDVIKNIIAEDPKLWKELKS